MLTVNDFKIFSTSGAQNLIHLRRDIRLIENSENFINACAFVICASDFSNFNKIKAIKGVPIFIIMNKKIEIDEKILSLSSGIFSGDENDINAFNAQLEIAINEYEASLLPPFTYTLLNYLKKGNVTFACPGHQGTNFLSKHPTGKKFIDIVGSNIFHLDVPHAGPMLGEVLTHQGAPYEAEKFAASVFNADKTYFVLNGTSTANKVVTNALLTPGDLVLFDRNNHKSCYHGALFQAGAIPIYLEVARNSYGFIGGITNTALDEEKIRLKIKNISDEKYLLTRPFRLAIIQFGTCDGTISNARFIIDKIGHLCDYILFDCAWLGYDQFIGFLKETSPLLQTLNENDPGIIVTQSVHKQMSGLSQTSQIHKKDNHIKEQKRYCSHDQFNHSFMLFASTSPFYLLFSSLEINAKIHSNGDGDKLWNECIQVGIEARKLIIKNCKYVKPFIPETIDNKKWNEFSTEEIMSNSKFFSFSSFGSEWHHFNDYSENQYFLDPAKLVLITTGIDSDGNYQTNGIPATFLATFLRENGITPEKSELNSISFLLTPAVTIEKILLLINKIIAFEEHFDNNSYINKVFPTLETTYEKRFNEYKIKDLCQEMHIVYKKYKINDLLKQIFMDCHIPKYSISPYEANLKFVKGETELIPLENAFGRIAAEAALPYPPGIVCIAPGEIWGGPIFSYFLAIQELLNKFPQFAPDFQGLKVKQESGREIKLYINVIKTVNYGS